MSQTRFFITALGTVLALLCGLPADALALEKYGRPLPSMEQTDTDEREVEESLFAGYFMAAVFPYNPTFAARPNNTGLVGMRYMLHLETDLYKQYLTFYTDQNFFSDRTNGWIELSEWDGTYAFTGVVDHFNWRLQYERDAPINPAQGLIQAYADGLVTGKLQSAQDMAWWRRMFPHQSLTMYAGAGWLFFNNSYFARPDNTGQALFRYVAHMDLDLYKNKVVLYGDINMFTDKELSNKVRPTELDWIVGVALHWKNTELAVYYEQDQPLDQSSLIQKYLAVQLRFSFDVSKQDMGWAKPTVRDVVQH